MCVTYLKGWFRLCCPEYPESHSEIRKIHEFSMATCLSTALKRSYFHHTFRISVNIIYQHLLYVYISHLWDILWCAWMVQLLPLRNDGVAGVKPWRCWDNFPNESCFLVDFGVFLRGGLFGCRVWNVQMLRKRKADLMCQLMSKMSTKNWNILGQFQ